MSNTPSLAPHFAILPMKSNLLKKECKGYSIRTHTV